MDTEFKNIDDEELYKTHHIKINNTTVKISQ